MKVIWVVLKDDAFSGQQNVPVYSAASKSEVDQWVKDEEKENEKYEVRGLSYRCTTVKFCNR